MIGKLTPSTIQEADAKAAIKELYEFDDLYDLHKKDIANIT